MRIFLLFFMFFIIGGLLLISNYSLALYKGENVSKFSAIYSEWLGQLFGNSQKLAGNVVKLKWLPTNISASDN